MGVAVYLSWVIMLITTMYLVTRFIKNKLYAITVTFLIVDLWMLLIWWIVRCCI